MPVAAIRKTDIGGFLPTFHQAQVNDIRVLRGRNFRWHYDGPLSGWGNKAVSGPFSHDCNLPYYSLFHFNDKSILATPQGIYSQNDAHEWVIEFPLNGVNYAKCEADYPWSTAFVGDSYYFSHPTVGIIAYNRYECKWSRCKLSSCVDKDKPVSEELQFYDFADTKVVTENLVYGIAEAGNRLIVLSKDTIGHSAIDDGCELECDPFCGGGFVSSSLAKYGKPLGVFKTLNGFAVFTSNAIVQARDLESIGAFSYKAVNYNVTAVSPYAITQYGSQFDIVFLSKAGFKIASLNRETLVVQDFESEIGSWLVEKELVRHNWLAIQHSVRLYYSEETEELCVSLLDYRCADDNVYNRALVYSVKYKKWASFDQPHYCFGPVNGIHHRTNGFTFGFLASDRSLRWFDYGNTNAGQYLDSFIEVGPFALPLENDILSESVVDGITLFVEGNNKLLANNLTANLKVEKTPDQYHELSYIPFDAEVDINSSQDGYTLNARQHNKLRLTEFNSNSEFTKNYACESAGLYHNVIIKVLGANGYYGIKRVDVKLRTNGTTA